jgi:hypothetical protein
VRLATFKSTLPDIKNSLKLGLIKNRGTALTLSLVIDAAKAAATRGYNKLCKNILYLFEGLIKIQSPKHMDKLAAKVLLEDADSLLAQYP